MKKILTLLVVATIGALLAFVLIPSNKAAPDFALPDLQGKTITNADLKDKVTLINFWFPSCPGCVTEMPKLIRMHQDYQGKNFQIIAISISVPSDPLPVVQTYAQTHRLPFTVLHDAQGRTQQAYQVIAAPTSFLVDKNGRIAKTYVGEPDFAEVYRLTDQLLAK